MSASKLAEFVKADTLLGVYSGGNLRGIGIDWAKWQRLADWLNNEMALRVFEDTRERAAKIAADAIAPNRRDIADAIRAMQPDGK